MPKDTIGRFFPALLEKHQPTVLFFEHKHMSENELKEARLFLEPDFYIFRFESDFFCLRKEILKKSDLLKLNEEEFENCRK